MFWELLAKTEPMDRGVHSPCGRVNWGRQLSVFGLSVAPWPLCSIRHTRLFQTALSTHLALVSQDKQVAGAVEPFRRKLHGGPIFREQATSQEKIIKQ